jgi:hypothetical protein
MGESVGIDSLLGGWAMPKACPGDMRERVIAQVESGASRREPRSLRSVPARRLSGSSAFGRRAAVRPNRGVQASRRWKHADFLLGLIEKQPDLTLDEVVLAMRKDKILGSRTAVWRFYSAS